MSLLPLWPKRRKVEASSRTIREKLFAETPDRNAYVSLSSLGFNTGPRAACLATRLSALSDVIFSSCSLKGNLNGDENPRVTDRQSLSISNNSTPRNPLWSLQSFGCWHGSLCAPLGGSSLCFSWKATPAPVELRYKDGVELKGIP